MGKRKNILSKFYKAFGDALYDTIDHDGIEHAGHLAFLSLLALFPFLVFFVAIAGAIGESGIGLQLTELLLVNNLLPDELRATLEPRMKEIALGPPHSLITIAIIGIIWTASSTVEGLRTILNRAYRVHTPPAYIWRRLLSIVQFLILTAVLIIGMMVLVVAPIVWQNIIIFFDLESIPLWFSTTDWNGIRLGITTCTLFLGVSCIYWILPNIKQRWRDVFPGAIMVMVGWMVTGMFFVDYLSNFDQVNLIYGSLGGIIVALLLFYILSMVLVFGAEFNHHFSIAFDKKLKPRFTVQHSHSKAEQR